MEEVGIPYPDLRAAERAAAGLAVSIMRFTYHGWSHPSSAPTDNDGNNVVVISCLSLGLIRLVSALLSKVP